MVTFRDLYIVRWLLQNTEEPNSSIVWQRGDSGMYIAQFHEGKHRVRVEVGRIFSPTGGRNILKFSSPGFGQVQVQEPLTRIFSRRYESEDDAELARTIRRLLATASFWHAQKEEQDIENEEERKQAIYSRLTGGDPD